MKNKRPLSVTAVTDNCSKITLDDLVIRQVTSDEPEDAKGDGHTLDDIVIAPDGKSVYLRIERQGMGDGRIYTVTIEAADENGNIALEPFMAQVPHDLGVFGKAIDSGSSYVVIH